MKEIRIAGAFTHYEKIVPLVVKYRSQINFTVYDGINECAWNGGRINRPVYDNDKQKEVYENLGVGIALVFSNPVIDLKDRTGLELLEKYHRKGNSIILQNRDLLSYIKEYYPLYKTVFSITAHPGGKLPDPKAYYQALEKDYDVIVPKLEHNMEIDLYANDISKYELLINDDCLYNCPLWKQHFDAIAAENTKGTKYYDDLEHSMSIEECWLPKFDPDLGDAHAKNRLGFSFGMSLSKEQLKNRVDMGINKYKISGREMKSDDFERNFAYLVETLNEV
jgi:hypothetical protein